MIASYWFYLSILFVLSSSIYAYFYYKRKSKWDIRYCLAATGFATFLFSLAYWGVFFASNSSVEIWNGELLSKYKDEVSCEHSYQTCTSDGKGGQVCTTHYEHSHDYDWVLKTTVGKILIDRVDSQGEDEPPRFTAAKIGEPVSKEHRYLNYVSNSASTILGYKADYTKDARFSKVLAYPKVHDIYRFNRVLYDNPLYAKSAEEINDQLNEALKKIGASHQVNFIVYLTKEISSDYSNVVMTKWKGAEKNDLIVFVDMNEASEIKWVDVKSWSKSDLVNVSLRNELLEDKVLNSSVFSGKIVKNVTKHYVRRPMEEFKYLAYSAEPTAGQVVFSSMLYLIGSLLGFFLYGKYVDRRFISSGRSGIGTYSSKSRGGVTRKQIN